MRDNAFPEDRVLFVRRLYEGHSTYQLATLQLLSGGRKEFIMEAGAIAALRWITEEIAMARVPYQITGGLAARAYGSTRDLYDIDLDVPEPSMDELARRLRKHIVFGPSRYKDDFWDLQLVTLNHHGFPIDLGGAYDTRIFDKLKKRWRILSVDLELAQWVTIEGIRVPVAPLEHLLEYKIILDRIEDRIDVMEIRTNMLGGLARPRND